MDITAESLTFLIFSALTLGAGLLVVTTRNLFHAGLYLMLALFGVAGLFALLSAPFLAGVQVVVYIGAIAILIILAIMLTPGVTRMRPQFNPQWWAGAALAVLFFLLLVSVVTPAMDELGADDWNADFTSKAEIGVPRDSTAQLGKDLVEPEKFMLPFEIASVLLMAALIGAVLLVDPREPAALDAPDTAEPAGSDEKGA